MNEETTIAGIDFALNRLNSDEDFQLGFFGGEPLLEWELLCKTTVFQLKMRMRISKF